MSFSSGASGHSESLEETPNTLTVSKVPLKKELSILSTYSLKEEKRDTQDGGYGWVIVFVSFVVQFMAYGISYTIGVFLIEIYKEYPDWGESGISGIAAIMIAMSHVAGPFASILVNLYGSRTVSIAGNLCAAIGFALSYFANGPISLYVTIGLFVGVGFGLIYLPAMVSVPQYFTEKRSLAMGIAVAGSGVGTFFFEWIFKRILDSYTWREGFLITGGIIFVSTLLSFCYRPLSTSKFSAKLMEESANKDIKFYGAIKKVPTLSDVSPDALDKAPEPQNSHSTQVVEQQKSGCLHSLQNMIDLSLLKNPYFIVFLFADILTSIGFNIPFIYLPQVEQIITNSNVSSFLGVIGVSSVISRLILGYIADSEKINRHLLYASCLIVAGLSTTLSPLLKIVWLLRIYSGIFGFCIGGYMSLTSLVLVDVLGLDKLTDAFGLLLLFQAIGFFIGLPVVGGMYDFFGRFDIGFYFAGGMILTCGCIQATMALIRRRRSRRTHENQLS